MPFIGIKLIDVIIYCDWIGLKTVSGQFSIVSRFR